MTRKLGASRLRDWALAIAERTGPRKAKVALARKLAVILHAMWRTDTPCRACRGVVKPCIVREAVGPPLTISERRSLANSPCGPLLLCRLSRVRG